MKRWCGRAAGWISPTRSIRVPCNEKLYLVILSPFFKGQYNQVQFAAALNSLLSKKIQIRYNNLNQLYLYSVSVCVQSYFDRSLGGIHEIN